jgi:2-dehydropantoate 2-reductase
MDDHRTSALQHTSKLRGASQMSSPVAVAGAGSIGCFVGGMLARAGHEVSLLTRPRIISDIAANGLRLTSFDGLDTHLAADQLHLSEDASILRKAALVLVTVKNADTVEIGRLIAAWAPPDAIIVSLQNGVSNASALCGLVQGRPVLGGMVPFNVMALGNARFHRATSGDIIIAHDEAHTAQRLSVPGMKVHSTGDIAGVQWGKLLFNLNNALNALSGLPLRDQLSQRTWRMLLADQMTEALSATRAANIVPVMSTPIPAWLTPYVLKLPDGLFRLVARAAVQIDPSARSSMWDDLQRHRPTEIDYLQGVIRDLAVQHGLPAPLTERIIALVKQAENEGRGSPRLTPDQIRADAGDGQRHKP